MKPMYNCNYKHNLEKMKQQKEMSFEEKSEKTQLVWSEVQNKELDFTQERRLPCLSDNESPVTSACFQS